MAELRVRMVERLSAVDRADWDALANPSHQPYDPFVSWDFLDALESSSSAIEETGWAPRHLIAEAEDGTPVGALPLYVKSHSYGEYVFDHAWADALERAGGRYYPKLVTGVPFTPATGRRLLAEDTGVRAGLINAARQAMEGFQASSWHILFPDAEEQEELGEASLLKRADIQYIFQSEGYRDYADFLDALSSRKRKALRKERAAAQSQVTIEPLTGSDIREEHWDVFWACYQDTGARKWGTPYLTRDFFSILHERMADKILLVMARRDDQYIASALNMIGETTLFGRYWGALDYHDSLHFELCYHQAIDYALANGLTRVEAGAQGAHKLARGYRPQLVYSAHDIAHTGLREAIAAYLRRERVAIERERLSLEAETPYKRGDGTLGSNP